MYKYQNFGNNPNRKGVIRMKIDKRRARFGIGGLIVALVICGSVLMVKNNNKVEQNQDYQEIEQDILAGSMTETTVPENKQNEVKKIEEKNEVAAKPVVSETKKKVTTETKKKELSFMFPVQGNLGMEYSKDGLVYSKTLSEWITHQGIDIIANKGSQVVACEDGIVEKIVKDPGYGLTIVIKHEDGYKSVYSNLSTDNMVKIGDKVKKGQVISGVGDTASFEVLEEPHLHFEMWKEEKALNPKEILK